MSLLSEFDLLSHKVTVVLFQNMEYEQFLSKTIIHFNCSAEEMKHDPIGVRALIS